MVGWNLPRGFEIKLTKVESRPRKRLSFKGKHNKVKLLALVALINASGEAGLTVNELARCCGTSPHSMRTSLAKWLNWGFVSRTESLHATLYQLRSRGHEWVQLHFWRAPFDKWYEMMDRGQREVYKHNMAQWGYLQQFTRH